MASLLALVLEEPRREARLDPRLHAYLQKAIASCHLYENLRMIPAKDIAAAVVYCREVGHAAAEDLSDVIVETVSSHMDRLDLRRVSFFITTFAKQQIKDTVFWKSAARRVVNSSEPLTPEVVVSVLDAFRKRGMKSETIFQALARRVMEVLQSLEPNHIPPIVATLCRVPMKEEDREEVIRELLVKWLRMLEQEKEHPTGAVTIQQILSLAVSLGLSPDIVNTAVFTKEVFDFIGNRFHLLRAEELIVFLWAIQRLVVPKSSTAHLARGLKQVQKLWSMLSASSELSLQRLIQLSEVLTCVKEEAKGSLPHWTGELEELQELVIQDLAESVQYCQSDTLAQILEIWHGSEDFWSQHTEFAEAIAKRIEELLLEFTDTTEILQTFQAALSAPGLVKCLSERAIEVLNSALSSRGADDVERVQAVVAGTPWEVLCKGTPAVATASEAPPVEVAGTGTAGTEFRSLLGSWRSPRTDLELADFLKKAVASSREAAEALEAVEAAAPFAEKLAANATAEVLQYLELLCKKIALSANELETRELVAAMRACAEAGLPYAPLCSAALVSLGTNLTAAQSVEVLESCAALRLDIPQLQPWLGMLLEKGLDRQLSASGLARMLAAAGRLGVQAEQTARILHRIVTVTSPIRPMQAETLASLCLGLTLQRWMPSENQSDFWQVTSWLATLDQATVRPSHGFSMRNFALGLLIEPEGRAAIDGLNPDLQKAMARLIRGTATHRRPVSDTTLKFRHEAAEVLRRAGRPYDLDISLGVGFVDLALPGPDGVFWLLDGPEAFRRPFRTDSTRPKLELVPMETFRSQLFLAVLNKGAVEAMDASLDAWEGEAPRNGKEVLGIPHDLARSKRFPWLEAHEVRLARLDWLEWERILRASVALTPDPNGSEDVGRASRHVSHCCSSPRHRYTCLSSGVRESPLPASRARFAGRAGSS